MSSEDSDDEPLSVLAATKKLDPSAFEDQTFIQDETAERLSRKLKKKQKRLMMTFRTNEHVRSILEPPVVQRPLDVWLYLKDFNTSGPYSCLLCPEWFINRSKIIVHYVINHKKDFCGICRYFVPDREAWIAHQEFHVPWRCSQCTHKFPTEVELRQHFSSRHNLIHCRMCYFRIPDNDQYNCHLFQRHNVTNVSSKSMETLWELDYEEAHKFLCYLCSKSTLSTNFFNHFMCYHRMTLKCFAAMISGKDPPFTVYGANIGAQFIENLKEQTRFGYIDYDAKPTEVHDSDHSNNSENNIFKVLIPEVKQEVTSETEDNQPVKDAVSKKKTPRRQVPRDDENGIWKTYLGDEDFDITSTELIILQKCYFDYVTNTLNDINSNTVPETSEINYESKRDFLQNVDCPMCINKYNTVSEFTIHMNKMHGVRNVPNYFCRVCAATFENENDLTVHAVQELGDFEDLWICQFCDKEFDTREKTRKHLTEHWESLEMDNCFSPHLGFKCRYCPTLFWNETDRETHQKRVHFEVKHKQDFYKCEQCSELFSDKVWYIHHFLNYHYNVDTSNPLFLLKCCLCCLVLPSVDVMREHFNDKHKDAKKIFCSLGSCTFKPLAQRKSFKFHLKTVHSANYRPAEGRVPCRICNREFPSTRAVSVHSALVHAAGRFKCKLCSESMHTGDERKLHYMLRHPGRHPFECSICHKSFQYKSSLYNHKLEHKKQVVYTCSYCSKVFVKKDSYREHLQIHEGPRHACSYCPARFVQRSNMLRHERRHTGERPYTCQQCGRTFADRGACNSHEKNHAGVVKYPCLICGQIFRQKSKLKYHTRKHTGEDLETCKICSKMFTSACSLREHMKTHSTMQVACPICDRKFNNERCMLRHIRTTHGHDKDLLRCPICEKTLTSVVSLRQHVISHSNVKTYQCKTCPKSYAIKKSMVRHIRIRHRINTKSKTFNFKEYSKIIDVRQCELGLDEEVLTRIFGPPVKKETDDKVKTDDDDDKQKSDEEDDNKTSDESESDDEASQDTEKDDKGVKVKSEPTTDTELEPTDFVSVKIEPLDTMDTESE